LKTLREREKENFFPTIYNVASQTKRSKASGVSVTNSPASQVKDVLEKDKV